MRRTRLGAGQTWSKAHWRCWSSSRCCSPWSIADWCWCASALVERVRSAVRWGVVRPWDGTGEQIANLILYDQPDGTRSATQPAIWG